MLGVVFTEFIESVESGFGMFVADKVQQSCPFHTGFTAVGNYDHSNLLAMVGKLNETTGIPANQLVRGFGKHIFQSFLKSRPDAFEGVTNTAQLMHRVQETIHNEVLAIYPNAELPEFQFPACPAGEFRVEYLSTRPFAELAHGILEACVEHYDEPWKVSRVDLEGPVGTHALFVLSNEVGS